jgi:dethiobiotin synthetase
MSAFFITATGTAIGKTFLTAGLVRHLRGAGREADAFKPVISGFEASTAAESDTGILLDALGLSLNETEYDRISPWRFKAPLSPDMAAAREGRSIDFAALTSFSREAAASADVVFIEGVGGVMVPLDATRTVRDWIAALGIPALLVTGSYLGTISHTLTAVEALLQKGCELRAVIVSETPESPVPLDETAASMARFLPGMTVAVLPYLTKWDSTVFANIAAALRV